METWHPAAHRVEPHNAASGTMLQSPWRQVLHTTEVKQYTPSRDSYYGHQSYPHATVVAGRIYQHYPINRTARALKNVSGGVETNRLHCIQVEIAWKAAEAKAMPPELLSTVRDWVLWVQRQTGHRLDTRIFYGEDAGFTLASPTSRQRMSHEGWRAFNGVCGHQHVPENSHWDPGAIDIQYLLTPSHPDGFEEEPEMMLFTKKGEATTVLVVGDKVASIHDWGTDVEQLERLGVKRAVVSAEFFDRLVEDRSF